MDNDTSVQDTNVTPVDEVPTAPVVDDQPSEETTADTLAPVEEAVEAPQPGDIIEPGDAPEDVAEEALPETVPHEACRGTGLKQGLPEATELCAGCEGSGVVKAEV